EDRMAIDEYKLAKDGDRPAGSGDDRCRVGATLQLVVDFHSGGLAGHAIAVERAGNNRHQAYLEITFKAGYSVNGNDCALRVELDAVYGDAADCGHHSDRS